MREILALWRLEFCDLDHIMCQFRGAKVHLNGVYGKVNTDDDRVPELTQGGDLSKIEIVGPPIKNYAKTYQLPRQWEQITSWQKPLATA